MATVFIEIEYAVKDESGEEVYEYLEVEFSGSCRWENDSIGSYEYWGAKCYDHQPDYAVCEEVEWDERKHTPEEVAIITEWLKDDDNYEKVQTAIEEAFREDASDYCPD
jgi:hypothetical protein